MTRSWSNWADMGRYFEEEAERWRRRIENGLHVLTSPLDTDLATTPAEVVYAEDKLRLLHYAPRAAEVHRTPMLVVYALVNRHTMLDLQPDRSLVRRLLDRGMDLYLIDWGYPTRLDRFLTMDDYINGYIHRCAAEVRRRAGVEKVTLLGICQGGTFCLCYSALHPERVQNLVTVVTPVDFDTDDGLLNVWARGMDVDALVDAMGNIPGDFMNMGFLLLNPFRLMFAKYVDFLDHVDDPKFVENFIRMEKWIFDSPDQAGETIRQFVKDLYQQNKLVKNALEVGGRLVDLQNITMPVANVYGKFDHLVPPASSEALLRHIPSEDKQELCIPTGHIGIFVSSKAVAQLDAFLGPWLAERSGERIPVAPPARPPQAPAGSRGRKARKGKE